MENPSLKDWIIAGIFFFAAVALLFFIDGPFDPLGKEVSMGDHYVIR